MTTERETQQRIRLAATELGARLFRANVGQAWTGNVTSVGNGRVIIDNARPFSTGLPVGFADLFGWDATGRFLAIECKSPTGKPTAPQIAFIEAVIKAGGLAGVARSVEDAERIILPSRL